MEIFHPQPAHFAKGKAWVVAGMLSLLPCVCEAAEWTVNTLADELDTPAGNNLSLREAIRDSAGGDVIKFAPELEGGTMVLTRGQLGISKNLVIDALTLATGLSIDGDLKQRVFSTSAPVTIRGITVTRGYGGGVLSNANLTMEKCVVSACVGRDTGAGIRHTSGSLTLQQCSILSNRADAGTGGGGIYSISSGNLSLLNCTIADNEAQDTSGVLFGGGATANVIHCTVVNNRSTASGAAITASSGIVRLQNSVIAGNLSGTTTRRDVTVFAGTIQKIGQNFVSCNNGVTTLFPESTTVGTVAAPKDALLSPMAPHGGKTPCFIPLAGSKLVNAAITSADTPATDQRGLARISGSLADLGSVEASGSVFFPAGGSTGAGLVPVLEWSHQILAPQHTVYFGTAADSLVSLGSVTIGRMALPELLPGTTYFWQVFSGASGSNAGPLLSFTTRPALVVTKTGDEPPNDLAQEGTSLREAVTLANANPGFDIIRFHPDLAGSDLIVDRGNLVVGSEVRIDGDSLAGGASIRGASFRISAATELRSLALTGGAGASGFGTIHVTGAFTARNCTISGNRAGNGGGIYLQSGSCTLVHCTVTGNTANFSGGGIYRTGGVLTLENSVIAGNRSFDTGPDLRVTASLVTLGNNLIGNNKGSETLFPAATLTGTDTSPLDPVLAPAGRHAGGLSNHCPPLPGSPAIGRALALSTSPATDQLSRPRPSDGSASLGAVEKDPGLLLTLPGTDEVDVLLAPRLVWSLPGDQFEIFFGTSPGALTSVGITTRGSFQLPALNQNTTYYWRVDRTTGGVTTTGTVSNFTTRSPIFVTTLADESDPTPADGAGVSLREAFAIAHDRPGHDQIRFSPLLAGGRITLSGSNLSASSELAIDASDLPGGITLDFAGARSLSIGAAGEVSIRALNFTGSQAPASGSALALSSGILSLADLTLSGNSGNNGAALSNSSGRLTVDRCLFMDNSGSSGGAIDLSFGISRIYNSTFRGNRASTTGGAIRCRGTSEFIHCTISGNLSKEAGGIKVDSSGCVLANCIVAGNTATVDPGRSDLYSSLPSYISPQGRNLIGINSGLESLFPTGPLAGTMASPLAPALIPTGPAGASPPALHPSIGSPALDGGLPLTPQPVSDQLGSPRITGPFPDLGSVEAIPAAPWFQPADLATGVQPVEPLRWYFEPGADLYRVMLATAGGPMLEIGTSTTGSFEAPLEHGTDYQWQVVAIRAGIAQASPVLHFTTRPRIIVTTLADENDAIPEQGSGISLREAIRLAAAVPGPDEIGISPALPAGTLELNGTELVMDSDVTIDGSVPGGRLVMDAKGQSRLFISQNWDVAATLENLVLRSGNTTGSGGGIANTVRMKLMRVDIVSCSSPYYGGAIFNSGQLEIEECSLLSNEAVESGTAIFATSGRTRIANSTIAHNRQKFLPSTSGSISCCAIDAGQLELINCTVAANRSARSAIRAVNGVLTHTTVTGNLSHNSTAGIEWTVSLVIRNCIVADNFTGGVESISSTNGVTTTTTYRNDDMVGPSAGLQSEGANLVGNNYKLESVLPAGPLTGTPAARLSPRLLDLGDYGGPTPTAPPTGASPALRAAASIGNGPSRDQRGLPRTVGITPDLGAADQSAVASAFYPAHAEDAVSCSPRLTWIFETGAESYEVFAGPAPGAMTSKGSVATPLLELEELEPLSDVYWKVVASVSGVLVESPVHVFTTRDHLTVTNSGDPLAGGSPGLSLRQAAKEADLLPGFDRIRFAPSVAESGIVLGGVPVELSGRLALVSEHGLLDIDGDDRSTVLKVFPGSDFHLENLHIHRGRSTSGAGIDISRSNASLFRCEVTGNIATTSSGAGAGLFQYGGELMADSCLFAGNQAAWAGGGIYVGDCNVLLRNCTLSGNSAETAGAFGGSGFADLENCTMVGNRATSEGGAMDLRYWPGIRFANCLIAGNLVIGSSLATPGHDLYSGSSRVVREGINFIGTNNSCSTWFPTGPKVGNSVTPLDPRLSPLADHGGATRCHLPLTGSPVIDSAIPLAGAPASDQRGLPRPQGGTADLGAVEVLPLGAAVVDTDLDGMDDRLEGLWGFTVGINDGSGDADGDGSTNADELGNHTNPRDPGDFLRLISSVIQLPPVAGGQVMMHLTWSAFPGLHYTVERSSNLDFDESGFRDLDAGIADGFTRSMTVPLLSGRDFVRIRRD